MSHSTPKGIVCAALLLGLGAGASPATPSPSENARAAKTFLKHIYEAYTPAGGGKGPPWSEANEIPRYFAPELAKRMLQDRAAAAKAHEVPRLDWDPFINAQDWKIYFFTIDIHEVDATRATGTVAFQNAGTAVTLELDLVKLPQGWRVADVHSADLPSLLEALSSA